MRQHVLVYPILFIIFCGLPTLIAFAQAGSVADLSNWNVSSYKVDLLNHRGGNGDVQSDQNGWVHLGSNHLDGGDIQYHVATGQLTPHDILEVWIDGYSTSNDLNIGPTVFIGTGKNRFEHITRMAGEAWRPCVFRFADVNLYGDVTDPSNRNANWRMRYPSSKYTMQRIDKAPHQLINSNTLAIRLSMTGAEDFVLKRMEVVIYRAQRGKPRKQLDIINLSPSSVCQGERITLQLNHSFPAEDVDLFIVDAGGYEHKITPHVLNTARDRIGIEIDPAMFSTQGQYQVKLVDRTQPYQEFRDSEYFEYLGLQSTRRVTERPRPAAAPQPPTSPILAAPGVPAGLPPVPSSLQPQHHSGIPTAQMMPSGVPMVPITDPAGVGPSTTPARVSAPARMSGEYTIQIGAYNTQAAAMTAIQKAQYGGFNAYIVESVKHGRRIFRVRVGRYPDKTQASQDAGRLRHHGFDTWITPLSR